MGHRPPPSFSPADDGHAVDRLCAKVQSLEELLTDLVGPRFTSLEKQLAGLRDLLAARRKEHFVVLEFAELVGRSAYTVRRWVSAGKLKAVRIGDGGPRGKFLIPRSELERLIGAGNGAAVPEVSLG